MRSVTLCFIASIIIWGDMFLFFTGNISFIEYLFGGVYFLHVVMAPTLSVLAMFGAKEDSNSLSLLFFLLTISLFVLFFTASNYMQGISKQRLVNAATMMLKGESIKHEVKRGSKSIEDIDVSDGSLIVDDFYPLERRADFHLKDKDGKLYIMIVTQTKGAFSVYIEPKGP